MLTDFAWLKTSNGKVRKLVVFENIKFIKQIVLDLNMSVSLK